MQKIRQETKRETVRSGSARERIKEQEKEKQIEKERERENKNRRKEEREIYIYVYIYAVVFDNGVFFWPNAFENALGHAFENGVRSVRGREIPIFTVFRELRERSSYCNSPRKYATSSRGNMLKMKHLPRKFRTVTCGPACLQFGPPPKKNGDGLKPL